MGLKVDHKYAGHITAGSAMIATQNGSIGYQVNLECEDGETLFVIWLTPKNRARAIKTFEALGVSKQNLANRTYLELQLAMDLEGKEVSFGTREEIYNNKKHVKVAWLGKRSNSDPCKDAADFFASPAPDGADEPPAQDADEPPVSDQDIPDF